MIVQDLVDTLSLDVLAGGNLDAKVTGGYASDLLSCVMAGAKEGNVWVTLQAHPNVVAVASLLDLSAVVVTEGVAADWETVQRAQENGVTILGTARPTFDLVVQLGELGIGGRR